MRIADFNLTDIPRKTKRSFYLDLPLKNSEWMDVTVMEAMALTSYDTLDESAVGQLVRQEWPGRKRVMRLPVLIVKGARDGRTLVTFAGVHPDEMEGQRAIMDVYRTLDPDRLSGTFVGVPVVNVLGFWTASAYNIIDRRNLARTYPGRRDGDVTERLAYYTLHKFIAQADLLVDLHGGGRHTTMPTMCGYFDDGAKAGRLAEKAAVAFGAPVVWRHDSLGPGRTLTAAADLGIPALYTECPSRGHLDPGDLKCFTEGVLNVMKHLKMLPGRPVRRPQVRVSDADSSGNMDGGIAIQNAGFFYSRVKLLDRVKAGQFLGEVTDLLGNCIEEIRAPRAGRVWLMRGTPRVLKGTIAFFIGN